MQVRKQVRTGHGTTEWFQTGKGVRQGCILSPCLFNLHAEYIMRNAGLDEPVFSKLPMQRQMIYLNARQTNGF